jgi:uncharacterized protein DUF5615
MVRLYLDEDSMREALVQALQARGIDVITALDAAMTGHRDADHLEYAASQGRVLVTRNVGDFLQPHRGYLVAGRKHAGIIVVQQRRYSVGAEMRAILRLIAARPAEDMVGAVEFLRAWE